VLERIFVPTEFREATSDSAWLQAMLDAERALAAAEARAGIVPAAAAEAIGAACRAELFDADAIGEQGRAVGNPAEPLVRALRDALAGDAADYVHWGATSQDIVDTAAMLVARRSLDLILGELERVAAACASLADEHRTTVMAGRTLLQQAVPITFGLKAAGWLVGVVEARRALADVRGERLAVQLGGAAGTLAPLGDRGAEVLSLFAEGLGLREPVLPWHTNRARIAQLGAVLAVAATAAAKIGLDVALLAQTEVAEVYEPSAGASSTMPHKRNPVGCIVAIACARQVQGAASVLSAAAPQEHERGLGGWQAEWPALSGALAYTGGAAAAIAATLEGLEVDADRMRVNLDGLVAAEQAAFLLAGQLGRRAAAEVVREASERARTAGTSLVDELRTDPRVGESRGELDAALAPDGNLGAAGVFVDRALDLYREARP
jgi:3-carboxy-cis,cis-muconate cycloisomerase